MVNVRLVQEPRPPHGQFQVGPRPPHGQCQVGPRPPHGQCQVGPRPPHGQCQVGPGATPSSWSMSGWSKEKKHVKAGGTVAVTILIFSISICHYLF